MSSIFKILIDRKIKGSVCTQGYIAINNKVVGYTLELPDLENKNYISSIPKATYSAFIRTDGNKGWRIELIDVPHRGNIQIHVGNYTSQIKGCILVGENVDIDNCSVSNSKKIMSRLEDEFNEFTTKLILQDENTDEIDIEVEIAGI